MIELKAELKRLYDDCSKHSVYQNIPDFVSAELGYVAPVDENWRGDRPRLAYLEKCRIPAEGERWLDFGANTGFFTLSLAHKHPQAEFIAVEANPNHTRFIELVSNYFEIKNIHILNSAVGLFDLHTLPHSDFMLHLNVLHHAGHDFDTEYLSDIDSFPEYSQEYLVSLRKITDEMLFQIGSNWGGDRSQPLVATQADSKKLEVFSSLLHKSAWTNFTVAYAHRQDGGQIEYDEPHELARLRDIDSPWPFLDKFPGEFYRRPLFYCQA